MSSNANQVALWQCIWLILRENGWLAGETQPGTASWDRQEQWHVLPQQSGLHSCCRPVECNAAQPGQQGSPGWLWSGASAWHIDLRLAQGSCTWLAPEDITSLAQREVHSWAGNACKVKIEGSRSGHDSQGDKIRKASRAIQWDQK